MPLSGHLSDLSLSELIEFFCNQRKTGQLKVLYPQGHGQFHLQTGSVVDARIGVLRGIEAVYYALTLPNAKFEFSGSDEPMERTINQPWTQVVLEGLRRLDEGVVPANAFPAGYTEASVVEEKPVEKIAPKPMETIPSKPVETAKHEPVREDKPVAVTAETSMPAFLSTEGVESPGKRRGWIAAAVVLAVLSSVAAIGVPAGWYSRNRQLPTAAQQVNSDRNTTVSSSSATEAPASEFTAPPEAADQTDHTNDAAIAAKRQHERDKAKAREEKNLNQPAASLTTPANSAADLAKAGQKKVTVTVTYDESGRVTQASGGDASAVRIARQKRFPAGKAGSATITIPIN